MLILLEIDRILTKNPEKNTSHESYELICVSLCDISICALSFEPSLNHLDVYSQTEDWAVHVPS